MADNTMAVMISVSGYSSVAIKESSGSRTPLILLDFSHLYLFLSGGMKFDEIITRIRRHSSQTGEAYLPVNLFGGFKETIILLLHNTVLLSLRINMLNPSNRAKSYWLSD